MPQKPKEKNKLVELTNSKEVEEYRQWRKWAYMFYSRMMPTEQNVNEILKRAEEGYLKTNPIAKEYLILAKKNTSL